VKPIHLAHSQYGEDKDIAEYFGDEVGRFLDIGANDGHTFSTTGHLAERGWSGVCVEPSPGAFKRLATYHEGRPVELVLAALTAAGGLVKFYDCADQLLSSTTLTNVRKFKPRKFVECYIVGITWAMLLDQLPGPYDFLNIDVEGINAAVALAAPLDEIGARVVCLEDDLFDERETVIERFESFGYKPRMVGRNILFTQ